MNEDEHAELIASLSHATDMITGLLDVADRLVDSLELGTPPTAADIARLREGANFWREQVGRLRERIANAVIEPPRRMQ